MGEIVSLNKFRKARNRADAGRRAAENRVQHGRGKAERQRDNEVRARFEDEVDSRRLDTGEDVEQSD